MQKQNFETIVNTLCENGGKVYYVGGYVRDYIMGIESYDIDLEVYGIPIPEFRQICENFGGVLAGEDFPVYVVSTRNKGKVEIALPRKEISTGNGYKDFEIFCDPFQSTFESAKRRDFTFNAVMMDVKTHEIIDHFNGQEHIDLGLIVPVANFADDPLRVFRAMRFALRFNFMFDSTLIEVMQNMEKTSITKERIGLELEKIANQYNSKHWYFTKYVFSVMYSTGWLEHIMPELAAMHNMEHVPNIYHLEHPFEHTMMVTHAAMKEVKNVEPIVRMLSGLYHDTGKVPTQTWHEDKQRHQYIGHENYSAKFVERFVEYGIRKNHVMQAQRIIQHHMKVHHTLSKKSAYNLWKQIGDDFYHLLDFGYCDEFGRKIADDLEYNFDHLYKMQINLTMWNAFPKTTGKDLIAKGETPGKKFGEKLDNINRKEFYSVWEK